jgi:hypothetical protein
MPSAANESTGSEPAQPKQDEGHRRRDRQLGRDQASIGLLAITHHRLRWRIDGTGSMGAKKARGRFTISHNLPVTRRCFHPRVIHSHPMDVTLGPDPYRGYLAPLRRGLLYGPETARSVEKHSCVPGWMEPS